MIIREYNLGRYVVPKDARNGICIDIGANVGSFINKYASFFKLIHYYEPLEQCFRICQNLPYSNLVGFNEAVYHTSDERLPMILHANHDSGSSALSTDAVNSNWSKNDVINFVDTVDLARVLERAGGSVDYMKIDCETSEYHFLINKDLTPIKHIGIELSWQYGQERHSELVEHILKTHDHVTGNINWYYDKNTEALFTRKGTAQSFWDIFRFFRNKVEKK